MIAAKSERRITVDGYVAMKLLTGTIMRYRIPYFGCWIESDIELDAQSLLNAKKKKDTKGKTGGKTGGRFFGFKRG